MRASPTESGPGLRLFLRLCDMEHLFENMAGVCPHCQTYAAMEPERRTEIYPKHADLGRV